MSFVGVPYAVKNLYDVENMVTLAGSIIRRAAAPAPEDAALVHNMRTAGAVLLGTTNMDGPIFLQSDQCSIRPLSIATFATFAQYFVSFSMNSCCLSKGTFRYWT